MAGKSGREATTLEEKIKTVMEAKKKKSDTIPYTKDTKGYILAAR